LPAPFLTPGDPLHVTPGVVSALLDRSLRSLDENVGNVKIVEDAGALFKISILNSFLEFRI